MKRVVITLLTSALMCDHIAVLYAENAPNKDAMFAQDEENFLGEDEDIIDEGDAKKRLEEERKKREEEEKKSVKKKNAKLASPSVPLSKNANSKNEKLRK